jgi:hypothetical protein
VRRFITLLLTYGIGVLACRWLVLGAFALDGPTLAAMVAIPIVQTAVLLAWRR